MAADTLAYQQPCYWLYEIKHLFKNGSQNLVTFQCSYIPIKLIFSLNHSAHDGFLAFSSTSPIYLPPAAATSPLSSLLLPLVICQPVKLNISLTQLPMKYFTEGNTAKLIRCLVEVQTGSILKTYYGKDPCAFLYFVPVKSQSLIPIFLVVTTLALVQPYYNLNVYKVTLSNMES